MLIISSDGMKIVNVNNLSEIKINAFWHNESATITAGDVTIGKYGSVDKAKAVLQDILKSYQFEIRTFTIKE